MKGSFTKRGRQCEVTLTKTHLKCCMKTSFGSTVNLDISLEDVLAVQPQSRDAKSQGDEVTSLVVHYAGSKKGGKALSWDKLVLCGTPELCRDLGSILAQQLTERLRPKHYVVLINPYSGKKTASRIFHKKVAPLLKVCGAQFKVFVTRSPDDVKNTLQDVDMEQLDGLLVVGGDGFYSSVLTALATRQQTMSGLDPNDPDLQLQPLPCPIGMLPGGTGNYLVMYLHGCIDAVHSTIKILLGKKTPTNTVSIHQAGRLEGHCGLILGFGLLGDMMHLCERNRWMGNLRYKVLPIRSIFNRRLFESRVEYQSVDSQGEWRDCSGQLYAVETGLVDLVDDGHKLTPTFGGPALTLHLTRPCPLGHHIKQLSKVAAWQTGAYDFEFVQSERVTKVRVSLDAMPTVTSESGEVTLASPHFMNVDGEVLTIDKPNFTISLHSDVVQLLG